MLHPPRPPSLTTTCDSIHQSAPANKNQTNSDLTTKQTTAFISTIQKHYALQTSKTQDFSQQSESCVQAPLPDACISDTRTPWSREASPVSFVHREFGAGPPAGENPGRSAGDVSSCWASGLADMDRAMMARMYVRESCMVEMWGWGFWVWTGWKRWGRSGCLEVLALGFGLGTRVGLLVLRWSLGGLGLSLYREIGNSQPGSNQSPRHGLQPIDNFPIGANRDITQRLATSG